MAKYTPDDKAAQTSSQHATSAAAGPNQTTLDLIELIKSLASVGGLPITLAQMVLPTVDLRTRLNNKPRLTVAFPPCTEELLALVKSSDGDEVTGFFNEYFKFKQHRTLGQDKNGSELDTQLAQTSTRDC